MAYMGRGGFSSFGGGGLGGGLEPNDNDNPIDLSNIKSFTNSRKERESK